MSYKRPQSTAGFRRARAHRSYSLEERPIPQPPPKILIKRKAAKSPEPEVVTPEPEAVTPEPEVVEPSGPVWDPSMSRTVLYRIAKAEGLPVKWTMKKATMIEMLEGIS